MSARNRRAGHGWEVTLAKELSAALGLQIVTARSMGLHLGCDLVTVTSHDARGRPVRFEPSVVGHAVEAKAVKRRVPGVWLRQAAEQAAPGTTPVVLWKRPNKSWRDGSVFTADRTVKRGWSEQPISEWLETVTETLQEQRYREFVRREDAMDQLVADRLADGVW